MVSFPCTDRNARPELRCRTMTSKILSRTSCTFTKKEVISNIKDRPFTCLFRVRWHDRGWLRRQNSHHLEFILFYTCVLLYDTPEIMSVTVLIIGKSHTISVVHYCTVREISNAHLTPYALCSLHSSPSWLPRLLLHPRQNQALQLHPRYNFSLI